MLLLFIGAVRCVADAPSLAPHAAVRDLIAYTRGQTPRAVNALDVLHQLIERYDLRDALLTLVSHPAGAGWRERAGPLPAPPVGTTMPGSALRELLSIEELGRRHRRGDEDVVSLSSRLLIGGENRHLALMDLQVSDELVPSSLLSDIVVE